MNIADRLSLQRIAAMAVASFDTKNILQISADMAKAQPVLHEHARRRHLASPDPSTFDMLAWVNKHPINYIFIYRMLELCDRNQSGFLTFGEELAKVRKIADGQNPNEVY